jgi:thiamine transporter
MTRERLTALIEAALTIALAAVLHFVRVWQMPAGGTISLEMLPIFVLAVRRGPAIGILAGAAFGVVDFFLEPFVVHWVQFFLDYPIAFGAVGLAGLWAPLWHRAVADGRMTRAIGTVLAPAVITGALARYVAHFASGVVFFATTALGGPLPNGQSAFVNAGALQAAAVYSALYNLYVPISAAACIVAMAVLMPALERVVPSGRDT